MIATSASSDSGYERSFCLPGTLAPAGDFGLMRSADDVLSGMKVPHKAGPVLSAVKFYYDDGYYDKWSRLGILAIEMETSALYINAMEAGKRALSLLTVSDDIMTGERLSPSERETSFSSMIEGAFRTALLA